MKKAITITGPTATGKTSLALHIAKKVNGALISADSIQVYKECDIISGKDIPKESKFVQENIAGTPNHFHMGKWMIGSVPLYLTDVVAPTYNFSVADFTFLVKSILKEIEKDGRIPIFVGGTTLYIKSLLSPIETAHIPPDPDLRERLETANVEELQAILAKYDKQKLVKMNESDIKNSQRLIRAIEIGKADQKNKIKSFEYNFLTLGLKIEREKLKEKIDIRVDERMREGAMNEACTLFEMYTTLSQSLQKANGYKQLFEYQGGKITKEESVQKWKYAEYLHAKNQMTFFAKMPEISWVDITLPDYPKKTISEVKNWISA